jgi:glycosyltransferase involved in cell wall biosynthesis
MKVLFVSRAKQNGQPSPVVGAQAASLGKHVDLSVFVVEGKGWKAYWQGIGKLRRHLREHKTDLVHAHYAWVGMVASMATRRPVVVSLMGSDIEDYRIGRMLIRMFTRFCWKAVIVKSQRSKDRIGLKNAQVIPNGVDLEMFRPFPREEARKELGFKIETKYALFLADPSRPEKNYALAETACRIAGRSQPVELMALHDIPHEKIALYLSAADVLLLTSHFEGSPNAVKEAMACNCPVVSVDVGDVKDILQEADNCYIADHNPQDLAKYIGKVLKKNRRSDGRRFIGSYDDGVITKNLINLYNLIV